MDKYQKIRVLGKGSFGSAILIKRICDETLFVVKEVSFAKMSPREREEARHECTVLQQIKHPNIVRYIEHFENHNSLYIVMEYCDGGDLGGKIKHNRGPLKESTIMYYFSQICLAMEYLHSRHILHRDIKTMNIFLMKNGAVKLGDFGIATVLRNTMGVANTVCGTPYYFSPELCKNRPYNNKSDIWAMGILLYECATCGRHPFDGANMNQLMTRIVRGNYAPLSMSYSPEFRRLVEWCLQKTPARRPNIRQTLSLPIVRRSLEMLEQNLMLATQCRIRLKDIMDFDAALDVQGQNVDDPNKTEDFSDPSTAEPLSQGLTPGQAAAMAMARQLLPHPKPNPVAVMRLKPPGMKPKLAMPLPYSPYQQHILLHAHHPNHRSPGKIQTPKLMVKSSPTSAVQESVDAAPSTTSGSSPASCGPSTIPSEDPVDATNESVEMKRINAIIERYGNQDPRAKETIHAYMRRKQEEYQLRRKADMERRERRVAQRQSELKRVLERQRQAFQRNVDVISKPRKFGGQQQPGHPVVVARADPFRGLAPYMKVKEKPRRSAVNVKDVGKLAPPRRVAVAANSPRTLMDQSLDLMPALEPLAELQSASEMHASPLRPRGNPRAPPVVSTSTSGEQSMSRDERDLRRRMEKEREAAVHERMRADQRERVSHARELHGISARGRALPTKTSPAPKSASAARRSPLTSPTAAARRPMSSDAPPTDGHRLNHKSHSLPDCLPLALNGAAPRRTSAIPPAALNAQDLSSGSPTDMVFDGVSPRHHHLEPLSPVKLSPAMRLRSGDSSSTPSPSYPIGKTFERKSHTHVTGDAERGSNDSIEAELIDVPYGIGRPQEQRPKRASLSPVRSGSRKTDVCAKHIHRTNDEWVGVKRHPRSAEGAIYAGMARGPTVEDDSHLQLLHSMNLAMPSTLDAMDPARVSGEVSPSIPSSPHTASLHPLSITAISLGNMEDLRAAHHRASVAVSPRVERQSSTTEYDEMLQHLKDLLQKRGNHRAHPTSAGSSSKRRHAPPSPDADETDEDEEDRDGEEDGSESEGSFEELASGSSSTDAEDEDEDFADELPLSSPRYVVCEDSPQQHRHARVPSGDVEVSDRLHPLECHTPRELQPIKRPSATRT